MSAYVVSTDTIDYLVAAAAKYGASFYAPRSPHVMGDTAAETLAAAPADYSGNTFRLDARSDYVLIGAILLAANVQSVNYRYDQHDAIPDYPHRTVSYSEIDPVAVLKSVRCLRYQSCETPDYDKTFAAAILDTITIEAIHHLPGYEDAPWGWTRQDAAERQQASR
jgi:hypothetical protein